MQLKSVSSTFWLNFFVPGAGHIYASAGEKWWLLAAHIGFVFATMILFAVAGPLGLFPMLLDLLLWIRGMVESRSVTEFYNEKYEEQVESERRKQQRRQHEEEQKRIEIEEKEKVKQVEMERRGRETAAEKQRKEDIESKRVSGTEVARLFARLHVLTSTGVMDAEEAGRERAKLLASTLSGWTDEGIADFLEPFAELAQQEVVTPEDVKSVKTVYAALRKGRPD